MSDIIKRASAGTMESSDAYVEISPADKGLEISLDSGSIPEAMNTS